MHIKSYRIIQCYRIIIILSISLTMLKKMKHLKERRWDDTYNLSNLGGGINVVHRQIHLQIPKHTLHTVIFATKIDTHTLLGIVLDRASNTSHIFIKRERTNERERERDWGHCIILWNMYIGPIWMNFSISTYIWRK